MLVIDMSDSGRRYYTDIIQIH